MFLKFPKRIFIRSYCHFFFTPALNVCGSVCLEDGPGVTEAINVYSILHAELSAILKSWVEQNYIGAVPSLDHMRKYLISQDNTFVFPKFFNR